MSAWLIVRAQVAEADHSGFDTWYRDEHLPDALKTFGITHAWRGWSDVEADLHYAFYEFESLERAREVTSSDAIKGLIAEFDRCWEGRVVRTREIVGALQTMGTPSGR
jgi:hypothetical protein